MALAAMVIVLGAAGCVAQPGETVATGLPSVGFASSQIKPSGIRPALPPLPRDPARLAKQKSYFSQLAVGEAPDKGALLSPVSSPLGAGVRDLRADAIIHRSISIVAGQTVTLETRRLTAGGDTVMYLWSRSARRQVVADDDSGAEPGASRLVYTAPSKGTFVVIVRSFSAKDDGRCDLVLDGRRLLTQARFGGATVRVAGRRTLSAILLNDRQGAEPWPPTPRAASDTLVLLIDPSSGDLLGLDDDSGVELGSRIVSGGAALAVIGAYSASAAGSARLIVDDGLAADTDGDGLGDGLEKALCLCAAGVGKVCGFDCAAAASPQDTDGDGLSDAAEVLGLDHAAFPQLLPRWGADPRRKDLFVEIDLAGWTDTKVSPPVRHFGRTLSSEDAHAAARVFSRLTGMQNPDGTPGIRLHLDRGRGCGRLSSGVDEVCGDLCSLGRDGVRRCGQSTFTGPPSSRRVGLHPARRHLFHVAVADCLVAGQAPGGPSDNLEFDCDRYTAMVHELGHNLGLGHYGTPATGGGNCKPNYPSLMNYSYSDRFDGGREVQFSDGALIGAGDLSPRDLDEISPYGGPAADVSWLATRPFYYTLFNCKAPGVGCQVDFNRDGRLDASVRAYLSPMPNYGYICENYHGNVEDSENVGAQKVSSGPAAAELTRTGPGRKAAPAIHVIAPARVGGKTALKLNHSFAAAGGWVGWTTIAGPALRKDTQAAAVTAGGAAGRMWIFACRDGEDPILYATLDPDGALSSLSPVPGQPAWLRARDVSVAAVGGDVTLLVRDDSAASGGLVYLTQHTPAGWSKAFTLVTAESAPLRSTVTPALASAPDGRFYVVTGDPDPPVGSGPVGRVHLYGSAGSGPPVTLEDEELGGVTFEDGTPSHEHVPWSRPALVFAPHLDGKGKPLSGGRGYLALWWNRGTRTRHLWTWGRLDASGHGFNLGRWHHYEAYGYTDAIAGSGPALVVRKGGQLSAFISQSDRFPDLVRHVPYADGIPGKGVDMRDFDDRPVIRQNLCAGLNWQCKQRCKRLSDTCPADTQPAAMTEVQCLLPRWPVNP